MHVVPLINIVGCDESGKTTVIENLVRELKEKGYRVATAKYSLKDLTRNIERIKECRCETAGANPTISVSEKGIKITINDGVRGLSLGRLIGFVSEVDVILLKDFPQSFLSDEKVATIICVRGPEEYERFKEEKEEVIAFCSSIPMNKPVLRLMEDLQIISMKVRKYIERENKVSEILQLLPRLDCGKCGYSTCEEMAVAIYNGESRVEDCFTLRVKSKLKTKVIVNDVEVPIQPFVSEIIRKSVLGMISSLKEVSIKGDETVHIDVSS